MTEDQGFAEPAPPQPAPPQPAPPQPVPPQPAPYVGHGNVGRASDTYTTVTYSLSPGPATEAPGAAAGSAELTQEPGGEPAELTQEPAAAEPAPERGEAISSTAPEPALPPFIPTDGVPIWLADALLYLHDRLVGLEG
jgi:hypothetical protein